MKILAIETSCDETAAAVLEATAKGFRVLSNIVSSQVKIHARWGGVVPNLARREHQKNLIPVLKKALSKANLLSSQPAERQIPKTKLQTLNKILEREPELLKKTALFLEKCRKPKVDLIAVTNGPGLEPALWVGINFARALAEAWNKPLIPVNHMEGHLFSVFLKEKGKEDKLQTVSYKLPAVALLVSGGHTELVLVKKPLEYKSLGQTRDDAAGEAFDKVAKMLGLGYPGGPAISREAAKCNSKFKIGNWKLNLPRPMIDSDDYDFSFSGLKTAVLYKIRGLKTESYKLKTEVCREFQQAVIDVLTAKTIHAAAEYKARSIIIGGGVAANSELRRQMSEAIKNNLPRSTFYFPAITFTGDNAAMIALAAYFRSGKKRKSADWRTITAQGNLKI